MKQKLLYLFTRTPLHVGAGSSVGAIDQPIVRERHTGFPVIPASSLKGTFADAWNDGLLDQDDTPAGIKKVRVKKDGTACDAAWLFGSDSDKHPAAGALQFSEAKLLLFPIRSAKGSFAWITCPLMLQRASRNGVFEEPARTAVRDLKEPGDEEAMFTSGRLDLKATCNGQPVKQVVLEDYTFTHVGANEAATVGEALAGLLAGDPVWTEVKDRLVILSNGMMSFFVQNACEVAQHVRISDETGTAAGGALFNQENVPSETLFYCVVTAFKERTTAGRNRTADEALDGFRTRVSQTPVFQFGGDASTGLGYCTLAFDQKGA